MTRNHRALRCLAAPLAVVVLAAGCLAEPEGEVTSATQALEGHEGMRDREADRQDRPDDDLDGDDDDTVDVDRTCALDVEETGEVRRGEAKACGRGSRTMTMFEAPPRSFDVRAASRLDAREQCAAWAMKHSRPKAGWHAPACPGGCPAGTSGCQVTGLAGRSRPISHNADVIDHGDGTFECAGSLDRVEVQYRCTPCTFDDKACR
ncbi:MAG: hypothetical protein R2939_20280 [Kofleriaceae bacterium]